jgi:hypothetical protein
MEEVGAWDVSLDKYIPFYREIDDEEFFRSIAEDKEFAQNTVPTVENRPEDRGVLLSQQRLIKSFVNPNTPYDRLLLFHRVGVGKCIHPREKIIVYLNKEGEGEENLAQTIESLWEWWEGEEVKESEEVTWKILRGDYFIDSMDLQNRIVKKIISKAYREKISSPLREIYFQNKSFRATILHKFFRFRKGEYCWTNQITAGDSIVVKENGKLEIKLIESIGYEWYDGMVYDLEVEETHSYFCSLGDVQILTHNTCSAIAVAENFANTIVDNAPRKVPLILVKNEGLIRTFITEIHSVCTVGKYGNEMVRQWKEEGDTEELINRKMTNRVKGSYLISTFETFLKRVPIDSSPDRVREEFSNRIIIVD